MLEGGVTTRPAGIDTNGEMVMPGGLKQLPKTYVDKFKEGVRTDDY